MARRVVAVLLVSLLASVGALQGFASCFFNLAIANSENAAFSGFSANPEEVRCRIWILGKGVPGNSGGGGKVAGVYSATGYDSGTMVTSAAPTSECHPDEFGEQSMLYQMSGCRGTNDMYMVLSDWYYTGFDGCPQNASDRVVIFAEDTAGRYSVLSQTSNGANWGDLDAIPTQTVQEYPRVATATRTSPAGESPVTLELSLSGTPSDGLGGYAPGDAPPAPLVRGYEIYYQHAEEVPAAKSLNGWTLCEGGQVSGATPGLIRGVKAPLPPEGKGLYLLSRMVFDSGYKASLGVSPLLVTEEQLFSKIFVFVGATPQEVNWVSGKEEQVVSYQLYWTPGIIHAFKPIGEPLLARGGESSYTAPILVPKGVDTFLVRVRAEKKDESFEWSRTLLVDRKAPPPKPEGAPGAGKP